MSDIQLSMEIVINRRHGGFSLSEKAQHAIAGRKGLTLNEKNGHLYIGDSWNTLNDMPRNDPDLIAVVRELGVEANTDYSDLRIADIGIYIEITSFDGMEDIHVTGSSDI